LASVYRPTYIDKKTGKRKKGKTWRIAYRDENGQRRTTGGFTDKQASLAKGNKLERDAERLRAGLPVARDNHLQRKWSEVVDAYVADLERQGRSAGYRKQRRWLLNRIADGQGWTALGHVRADGLTRHLAELRKGGAAGRTLNDHRNALYRLCEWCVEQDWLGENPVARVKESREEKRRRRRAFTRDEFLKLVAVAPPARQLIYQAAALSGLRRKECVLLERRDLTPAGERPTWHLRPEIDKSRRLNVVPMLPEATQLLARHWLALEPTQRVFAQVPNWRTLKRDMRKAGIARVDGEGRHADFHSLRYFFATEMSKRAPMSVVSRLMRHKSIKLTMDLYAELGLRDLGDAIENLPPLLTDPPARDQKQQGT
jgi:site-specific recombinase XerC